MPRAPSGVSPQPWLQPGALHSQLLGQFLGCSASPMTDIRGVIFKFPLPHPGVGMGVQELQGRASPSYLTPSCHLSEPSSQQCQQQLPVSPSASDAAGGSGHFESR